MGRWANRSRRGGGTSLAPPATITITGVVAEDTGAGHIIVTFSAPVSAGDFNANAFTDVTAGNPAEAVSQDTPNSLLYESVFWQDTINPGDAWIYSDTVLNVVTPQNGVMT